MEGMRLLLFAQGNHLIHIEELLAPFHEIGRINDYLGTEMALALLIARTLRTSKHILLVLHAADGAMLEGSACQDTKLPPIAVLLRGVRAFIVLHMYRPMPMISIVWIR